MIKVRNKLPTWSRQDILNLATAEFKKLDLTKPELAKLIGLLKDPKTAKPAVEVELTTKAEQAETPKIVLRSNRGDCTAKYTHWEWGCGRFFLVFGNVQDSVQWALKLILADQTRSGWSALVAGWNKATSLRYFEDDLFDKRPLSQVAHAVLERKDAELARLRTPLPDNATMAKRYWSLKEGDTLTNKDCKATIVQSRINMEGPPVITLEVQNEAM